MDAPPKVKFYETFIWRSWRYMSFIWRLNFGRVAIWSESRWIVCEVYHLWIWFINYVSECFSENSTLLSLCLMILSCGCSEFYVLASFWMFFLIFIPKVFDISLKPYMHICYEVVASGNIPLTNFSGQLIIVCCSEVTCLRNSILSINAFI